MMASRTATVVGLWIAGTVLALPTCSLALTCGQTLTTSTLLTSDLTGCTGHGLQITASNITLECSPGKKITGTGSGSMRYGVYVHSAGGVKPSNVKVIGCEITGFWDGIRFEDAANSVDSAITGNFSHHNAHQGINVTRSAGVLVDSNIVESNSDEGIHISEQASSSSCPSSHVGGHTIRNNSVSSNVMEGIYVLCSSENRVEDNLLSFNQGVGINIDEQSSSNLVLRNNMDDDSITIKASSRNAIVDNDLSVAARIILDGASSIYSKGNASSVVSANECFNLKNGASCNQSVSDQCNLPDIRNIVIDGSATIRNRFLNFFVNNSLPICALVNTTSAKTDVYDASRALIGCAAPPPQVDPSQCAAPAPIWWMYDELCDDGTAASLGEEQANAASWTFSNVTISDTQYYRANDASTGSVQLSVTGPVVVAASGCMSVSAATAVKLFPGTTINGRFRAVVM